MILYRFAKLLTYNFLTKYGEIEQSIQDHQSLLSQMEEKVRTTLWFSHYSELHKVFNNSSILKLPSAAKTLLVAGIGKCAKDSYLDFC